MSSTNKEQTIRDYVESQLTDDTRDNLANIKISNVYANRYRVNCYTKRDVEGFFVTHNAIAQSFFVQLVDGEVIDHTVEASA